MTQLKTEQYAFDRNSSIVPVAKDLVSLGGIDGSEEKQIHSFSPIKRLQHSIVLCIAVVLGVVVLTAAMPSQVDAQLVPSHAKFRGKSFGEWNYLATEWFIATELGGQDRSDTVKGVRFLPGNNTGEDQEFDVNVRPGTGFVYPPFFVFGEMYDDPDVPNDDPEDPFLDLIFQTTFIEVKLDGVIILQGFGDELDYFGPTYFESPIFYAKPQPRGPDLNSIAAIFVAGNGMVFHPMSRGVHTLESTVESMIFGDSTITHHITVGRRN